MDSKPKIPESRFRNIFHFVPARYIIGILGALAIVVNYWIKISLSVAIVAMVKSTHKNSTSLEDTDVVGSCPRNDQSSTYEESTSGGDFDWDENMQGVILSSYFYGYVATQLLGGVASQRFGGKYIIASGVTAASVFVILSPVAAKYSVGAFIATRVLQGMASGVIFSGLHPMFTNWFSAKERQTMFSLVFSSTSLGSVVSMSISGVLSSYSWELAFYVPGAAAFIWLILWMVFVYNSPLKHPWISEKEKSFIIENLDKEVRDDNNKKKGKTPYFKILTSGPVWTYIIMGIGFSFVSYIFLSELPTYAANILHYDIQSSGFISALPQLSSWISSLCSSFISQWIQRNGYLSKMNTYRLFNAFAQLGPAVCLLAVTLLDCNADAILALLVLTMVCSGSYYGGSASNHMDLASNYVGLLAGLNLTLGNATAIVAPLVTGALTNRNQTLGQWKIVFYITMAVSAIPYFMFMIIGSAEEQEWNKTSEVEDDDDAKKTNS